MCGLKRNQVLLLVVSGQVARFMLNRSAYAQEATTAAPTETTTLVRVPATTTETRIRECSCSLRCATYNLYADHAWFVDAIGRERDLVSL